MEKSVTEEAEEAAHPAQEYKPYGQSRRFGRATWATWAAYAACAWALLFALMSFYWAAGGDFGLNTLGSAIQAQAHNPGFVAIVWLTGLAKIIGALFALTLVRPWARWLPRRAKLILAWAGGIGLALYGGVQLLVEGAVLASLLPVAGAVDWAGLRWHVWLWDPWWLLGGVLFLLAAWQYQRASAFSSPAQSSHTSHSLRNRSRA